MAVGGFYKQPDSRRHQRPSARRERNEMVTDFLNAHLRQARRCAGRYRDHGRAKPEACGVDRGQRQESDKDLRDSWPRRSFLRRKHNSKRISECAVRGNARSIAVMQKQASAPVVSAYWEVRFPRQIDSMLVIADELKEGVIELEGEQLVSVPLGHTDTDSTTCLHVPSIGLVVAGDSAYNDVHLHLGESNAETRKDWIAALDTIESLKPAAVVAGHKRPGAADTPNIIEETRKYIRDFDRTAANTHTALELYHQMLVLYPDRVNPAVLWNSARAVKPGG